MTAAPGAIGRLAGRLPDGLVDASWLWLVMRVGLGLIAALVVAQGGAASPCSSDVVINHWTTIPPLAAQGPAFPLVGVWQHWDACWYSKIAAYGYEPGVSSTTFFPLLPFLMSGVAVLVGGNVALAGLIVNAVAFVVALTGVRQLVAADVDRTVSQRTILYLAIFPAALFFFAPFTESLFLAGSVWAIAGARRDRWDIAFIAGLVAGLARPQGVLLVLPVGWEAAKVLRNRWRAAEPGRRSVRLRDLGPVAAAAAPAVAYLAFVAYTAVVVGRSYFAAHLDWAATEVRAPWDVVASALAYAIPHNNPVTMINVVGLGGFALLAIAGLRLLPLSYSLFVLPQLAVAMTQQTVWPLMSMVRYLGVLFPCFVVLAIIGRRQRLHTGWLVLSLLLLGYLTTLFVEGTFIA